jgi:hypothetical protein
MGSVLSSRVLVGAHGARSGWRDRVQEFKKPESSDNTRILRSTRASCFECLPERFSEKTEENAQAELVLYKAYTL